MRSALGPTYSRRAKTKSRRTLRRIISGVPFIAPKQPAASAVRAIIALARRQEYLAAAITAVGVSLLCLRVRKPSDFGALTRMLCAVEALSHHRRIVLSPRNLRPGPRRTRALLRTRRTLAGVYMYVPIRRRRRCGGAVDLGKRGRVPQIRAIRRARAHSVARSRGTGGPSS